MLMLAHLFVYLERNKKMANALGFSKKRSPEPLKLDWVFTFGKYKGDSIQEVIENGDADYVMWCQENVDWFDLHVDVLDYCLYEQDGFISHNLPYRDYDCDATELDIW